jgi:hypothetical protein
MFLSAGVAVDEWGNWLRFLVDAGEEQSGSRLQVPRVLVAVALTVYAARTDRRWLLVVAMMLASPVWSDAASLTLLAALPRVGTTKTPGPQEETGPWTSASGEARKGPDGPTDVTASHAVGSGELRPPALESEVVVIRKSSRVSVRRRMPVLRS